MIITTNSNGEITVEGMPRNKAEAQVQTTLALVAMFQDLSKLTGNDWKNDLVNAIGVILDAYGKFGDAIFENEADEGTFREAKQTGKWYS